MRVSNTNLLQVQLTEAEKRHFKALAAGQGLTLRQATLQAFQAWELQLQSRACPAEPARGAKAGAGPPLPGQAKRATASSRAGASPRERLPRRPAAVRSPIRKHPGETGSAGRHGWTGQNVRRRSSYREKVAAIGWFAEPERRWLRSCKALPPAIRVRKLPRCSKSRCNSLLPCCSSRRQV